jgi:hypothetical protein
MDAQNSNRPSFSPWHRWSIGFNVVVIVLLVFAVIAMVNYLSRDYFLRMHWSSRTKNTLSPRTEHFLASLTNQVKITVYYDKQEALYTTVADLLNEYALINPRLSVRTVDYLRDPASAQLVKAQYKLANPSEKNLIIFDCAGRQKVVDGNLLAKYTLEQVPNEKQQEFRRKPTEFLGEIWFTSALINVTSLKPLKAYFLTGHNEHLIGSGDEQSGYSKFASVLQQNNIEVAALSLLGTNRIPMDCNLLIIGGPTVPIPGEELLRIDQYLTQGGRLLALFNAVANNRPTGLEGILDRWGVEVGFNLVIDPVQTISRADVIVSAFSRHPLVNPLLNSTLFLNRPRTVAKKVARVQAADAPKVDEIAFSSSASYLAKDPAGEPRHYPLMVAVEKGEVTGVITERGSTRMVVIGDSFCLANHQIDLLANRDFAGYLANWLLDRTQLMQGLGPRPIAEYRLLLTNGQLDTIRWVLLAGMPGATLVVGLLVWGRRRK